LEQQLQIEGWELAVARGAVRQFLRQFGGLRGLEENDLVQDCLAHWLARRGQHDATRASARTFMNHVVRHYLLDIARRASAKKRKEERTMSSLQEPILGAADEPDELTLEDTVPDERNKARLAQLPLQVDLATALTRLTPQQQALCKMLTEDETVAAISRSLKVPRATLYDEIKRVCRIFRNAGLKDYLD